MISPTFTPSILCDHLSAKMALWSQVYVWLIKQRGSKANTDHLTLIFTTRYPSVSLPVDLNSFLQTHLTYPTNSPPPQPPPLPLPTRWHCSTGCLHFFFFLKWSQRQASLTIRTRPCKNHSLFSLLQARVILHAEAKVINLCALRLTSAPLREAWSRLCLLGLHSAERSPFGSVQFSSVQDGIYALGKAHMYSTPSLRSSPNIAFETAPMFCLTDDGPLSSF